MANETITREILGHPKLSLQDKAVLLAMATGGLDGETSLDDLKVDLHEKVSLIDRCLRRSNRHACTEPVRGKRNVWRFTDAYRKRLEGGAKPTTPKPRVKAPAKSVVKETLKKALRDSGATPPPPAGADD